MDFWEFLTRSEWPALAGAVVFIFREPIKKKLMSATEASIWGVSAKFKDDINEASILVGTPSQTIATPEMIILDAWRQLIDTFAKVEGSDAGRQLIWTTQFDASAKSLGLSDDEISAFKRLRAVRNTIAHTVGAPVGDDDAKQFKEVTQKLIQRLGEPRQT